MRVTAIAQPLGIDQSLWASAARGMSRGLLLYRDVWEQRPPGIYWIYQAAFTLFGWTASTVAVLDLIAATATTVLLYLIARELAGRLTAGATAALYGAFTVPSWLYGNGGFLERAVSETFIVVCVCGMAYAAVRWSQHRTTASATALGLCAGATLIFKPNAGLYFPALLLWILVVAGTGIVTDRRRAFSHLVVMCGAALVLPAAALVWLWRLELLHDAKVAVIDFNRYYVGEGFDARAYVVTFSKAVWLRIKTEPLWLAGVVGAVVAAIELLRTRRLPRLPALTLIWGSAAVCVIVVNGARLFNSYFIQALPPLSLLAAWFLVEAGARSRGYRVVAAITGVLMAVLVVQRDFAGRIFTQAAADVHVLRGDVERLTYLERFGRYAARSGYSARANTELADYIRAHSSFDDRIFLFGINGAGVYFEADRLPAHRFLRVNFFVETEFPDPAFRLDAVVRDLEQAPPLFVIFERLHVSAVPEMARRVDALPEDPDVRRLLEAYDLVATIEDFTVWRRR